MTPIAISDDWTYARSAHILLAEGRLTVFPVVVATAVAPIAWGALFGLIFGSTLGVFRLSTYVLTASRRPGRLRARPGARRGPTGQGPWRDECSSTSSSGSSPSAL